VKTASSFNPTGEMTATDLSRNTNRWSREQIRAARMAPLGLQLVERPADNFELAAYKGFLLKDSYWRWPERKLAGNAIDFFVQVLGLSFNDAMRQITGQ